jgi:uncharacterized protein YijF (DUF1287 family)
MMQGFSAYPHPIKWLALRPDANIDHRRVPNLNLFFSRKGEPLPSRFDRRTMLNRAAGCELVVREIYASDIQTRVIAQISYGRDCRRLLFGRSHTDG